MTAADGPVIRCDGLCRWYGDVVALNGVSTEIPRGITALLGPNGAGKSSFLRIAAGELRPSAGRLRLLGEAPFANPRVLARIGYAPEGDRFFPETRAEDFLIHLLRLAGFAGAEARSRAGRALEEVGLPAVGRTRLAACSRGMRQRVKLAQAIAHDPEVLLLDEPLSGLDPMARRQARELIQRRARGGATVLVSSHVLHEVESLTSRVLLIHRGRIAASGEVSEIRALLDRHPHRIRIDCDEPRRLAALLLESFETGSLRLAPRSLVVETTRPEAVYASLPGLVADHGLSVDGITSPDDRLEAVFDLLVGGGAA